MSCFKVMTFLGIVDMLALWVNSIITGFLAYQGAVYCSYPNLIYISGMAGFGLWCCSCIIAMSLVINRILDLSKESLCKLIFDGAKTYGVLTLPVIYGMYFVIFTTPIAFSSKHLTWFFNPLIFPNMTHEVCLSSQKIFYEINYSTPIFHTASTTCSLSLSRVLCTPRSVVLSWKRFRRLRDPLRIMLW